MASRRWFRGKEERYEVEYIIVGHGHDNSGRLCLKLRDGDSTEFLMKIPENLKAPLDIIRYVEKRVAQQEKRVAEFSRLGGNPVVVEVKIVGANAGEIKRGEGKVKVRVLKVS